MFNSFLNKLNNHNNLAQKTLGIFFLFGLILPEGASAGFFSYVSALFSVNSTESITVNENSQNMGILQATLNSGTNLSRGGAEMTIVGGASLIAESGPAGTGDFIYESDGSGQVSVYVVREGDTLSQISEMFGVSVNTIIWGNDITNKTLKQGQVLAILPVNGVRHKVAKGDSLQSITKKYAGDIDEVMEYNDLKLASKLETGQEIIIPHGQMQAEVRKPSTGKSKGNGVSNTNKTYSGYYMRPIYGGVRTQGYHGYNAVDIGAQTGTSIMASASGRVVISRNSGWNGGYGKYIVIEHSNGTQTLYAHANQTVANVGDSVSQGEVIAYVGNTGRSTGSHLHFEVRGANNPF